MRQYGFKRRQSGNARITAYGVRYPYQGLLQIMPAEVIDKHLSATNYQVQLSIEH